MIEIGIQDGRECNSSNLVMNFGWCACVIEADNNWAMQAENFYCHQGVRDRVRLVNVAATPENINGLLSGAAVPPGSEVLSIDIDSYDYWLWKAVDAMVPPLVVIEYNASFGPTRSVTVPYSEPFTALSRYYHGASITALNRLGKSKGYILAGCDSKGVNAFFVKMDLAANAGIKAVEPASAFRPHYRRTRKMTVEQQYRTMASLPLEEV